VSGLWVEISVSVGHEEAELAQLVLEQQGALAVTLTDDADHPLLEPEPDAAPLWPMIRAAGLFEAKVSKQQVQAALQTVPGLDRPQALRWRQVEDRDWTRAWMDRFEPMLFGLGLWIEPSGMQAPANEGDVVLKLDPGLAFGTGTHPTTALCLRWIDAQAFGGKRVVDYGCGSGVLGIATALKGAKRVVCVDRDPQALEATADNAERNGVAEGILCRAPEQYDETAADIVLANILALPLIELAPRLLTSLAPGGVIVLSGLLASQVEEVEAAYKAACGRMAIETLDGWALMQGNIPLLADGMSSA
jgi:ribosomal protein L11 methyltransferase